MSERESMEFDLVIVGGGPGCVSDDPASQRQPEARAQATILSLMPDIIARDTPTILGILFFSALVVIVGNLLTDLALRLVDPRVGSKA